MMDFSVLSFWHWLTLGIILLSLEILAPAAFLLWFGLGALLTSLLLWLIPELSTTWQIIVFAGFSGISVLLWHKVFKSKDTGPADDAPHLNNRLAVHIGKTYPLHEAIEQGRGRLKLEDSLWRVNGPDMPAGANVIVTAVNGSEFTVEAATSNTD